MTCRPYHTICIVRLYPMFTIAISFNCLIQAIIYDYAQLQYLLWMFSARNVKADSPKCVL